MPYTPPAQQQSPASSRNSSPALSRAASYTDEHPAAHLSTSPARPSLPRSMSSASYLNKQRRSPSIAKSEEQAAAATKSAETQRNTNGSVRQSPTPVNNLLIPTGAVISPPDSSENSDGEGVTIPQRGRGELFQTWGELQQAVRSISLKKESSPERKPAASMEPTTTVAHAAALSSDARRITHSRSSTETSIVVPHHASFAESPAHTSDESDDEDEDRLYAKPPLVRKKSGELVKPALRPSSRRRYSSMPGTPTYHKSVHFNDNGNQTRHFLQVDKPMAVSAGSSPVETYESETEFPFEERSSPKDTWEIKLANFPDTSLERTSLPIRLERLYLSADTKSLIGNIAVQNLSFQKVVVARFTLDYWKTTSEVVAEYSDDVRRQSPDDGCDRFCFTIRLSDQAHLEAKTLLLCMRYNVGGQEYWDSNSNMNYQIDFVKKVRPKKTSAVAHSGGQGARPLKSSIPRSKHSPPGTAGRGRAPSIDDDIVSRFDSPSAYHFGSPAQILGDEMQTPLKLKTRNKRGSLFPGSVSQPPTNGLGGRYDFGASLSAALSTAQDKLGRQSGLMASLTTKADTGYFNQEPLKDARQASPPASSPGPMQRPDAMMTTDRPAMGSAQYKDLVSKFCYFTPGSMGKLSPQPSISTSKRPGPDGTLDETLAKHNAQVRSDTPTPPQTPSPFDGPSESGATSGSLTPLASGCASSGVVTRSGYGSRSQSPVRFGYPYVHNTRDGYLSDSPAPTAIRG